MLETVEMRDNIRFLRRDRNSRGGGVAIAFDRTKAEFKKVRLESLRGKDFEIIAAVGKLTGIKKESRPGISISSSKLQERPK